MLCDLFCKLLSSICFWVGALSLGTYLIMTLTQVAITHFPNDLRRKYKADWALVTGASSGIGKEITIQLARQDINVVMVALDTPDFPATVQQLEGLFPRCRFRPIPVNLGDSNSSSYMDKIIKETDELRVNLVFNNAGFILPGMFPDTDYAKMRANIECNAMASIAITHHFVTKMMTRKERGFVEFTSSAAAYFPGPTSTMYSSTKAFISNFAASLAADVKDANIDVLAFHPSPVSTNFYTGTSDQMSMLRSAMKGAVTADVVAAQIIAAAGRVTIYDQGLTCAGFRLVTKVLDWAFIVEVVTRLGFLGGDHPDMVKRSKLRNPALS